MLTWTLVKIQGVTVLFCQKLIDDLRAKWRERTQHQKFNDGWQLHRTGIEPMSIAWKATMLPLHQRCSHENLWLYNEKQSSCVKNWLTIGEKKCRENAAPKKIANESQLHRTGIEPMSIAWKATMLPLHQRSSHLEIIQWETVLLCQKLIDDRRKSAEGKRCTKRVANGSQLHRTGIEPMSIAWKATMLPLHQRCSLELWWRYKE